MRNERTPRTLAETSFHTGYPEASEVSSEWWMYAAFLGWLAALLFGAHLVARHWGDFVALIGG
jgi:hypothetical protein